jgi:hypothetical protein
MRKTKPSKTPMTAMLAALVVLALFMFLSAGCQKNVEANVTIEPVEEINPITGEPYYDIKEKRGVKTNITEFNGLLLRASNIQSYKYNLTDSAIGSEEYRFYVLGRFVKVVLPEIEQHSTGEIYDEVLMDRLTKTAFSHCSKNLCPKPELDKEVEKVEFDDYYIKDPLEYLYKATTPEYVKEEMIGNDYVKVFNIKYEGKDARIWLQEYYGYPLKIMVRNDDDSKRVVKFEHMTVDNTRRGEIDLPFNFTVSGESKSWVFWEHYLGEWPEKGKNFEVDDEGNLVNPLFGA